MTIRALFLLTILVPAALAAQSFTFVDVWRDGEIQGAATLDGLSDAFAVVVSPGGDHVYVCSGLSGVSGSDNAIAVFLRAPVSGRLSFVEALFDAQADGLSSCRDVVVSPDGQHVYTAGFSDGAIGIFDRDPASGGLTFLSVVADGAGVDGLAGVQSLAMTDDGAFLFAVGSIDDALVAFARNALSGALSFEASAVAGPGVAGLDRPVAVAVSPDGRHVYTAAGSSANSTGSDAVAAFAWDGEAGSLTFLDAWFEGVDGVDGLHRVSDLAVSPDGAHVYATGALDPSGDRDWIAIFARSSATGELTWQEAIEHFLFCQLDILFDFETYLAFHPDGQRLFLTSAATALTEFARNPATGELTFMDAECLFDDLTLGINLPRKIGLDPAGGHVYVPGQADDAVAAFDTAGIFTDGFESGDLAAWSSRVP